MKISRTFILCSVGVLLLIFYIQLQMPRHFSWRETYNINSTQPFGTQLFDSMASKVMPGGYEFLTEDLNDYLKRRLSQDSVIDENLLIIDTHYYISQLADSLLYTYAMRGANVLIAVKSVDAQIYGTTIAEDLKASLPDSLQETEEEEVADEDEVVDPDEVAAYIDEDEEQERSERLHFYFAKGLQGALCENAYKFDLATARKLLGVGVVSYVDSIYADSRYPATRVRLFTSVAPNMFLLDTLRRAGFEPFDHIVYTELSGYDAVVSGKYFDEEPQEGAWEYATAGTMRVGRGSITVSLASTYFTNFGVVNPSGRTYVMRLLDRVSDKRLLRHVDSYQGLGEESYASDFGAFSYFLDRPPLAMALRLAIIGCLLALFVNARRRQRPIPPVRKEHNVTLHFLRQVALLYRPGDDYTGLLEKRFQSFAEKVRNRVGADVADTMPEARQNAARLLALHIGEPFEWTHDALRELHFRLAHEAPLSFRDFKACTDIMNRIQKQL